MQGRSFKRNGCMTAQTGNVIRGRKVASSFTAGQRQDLYEEILWRNDIEVLKDA